MKKNWLIAFLVVLFVVALYLIEASKIKTVGEKRMPTLDQLETDEFADNWDLFYKVRATLKDGQSATFSIPQELKDKEGTSIKMKGAVLFTGNGCSTLDENTTQVDYFFLLPSQGLVESCVLEPDIAMRWTILVSAAEPWLVKRNDMIDCEVQVEGKFRIDTSKPYEAAFFIDNSSVILEQGDD